MRVQTTKPAPHFGQATTSEGETEANAEVPKTAVPQMVTLGQLQKQVSLHILPIKLANFTNKSTFTVYSLVQKTIFSLNSHYSYWQMTPHSMGGDFLYNSLASIISRLQVMHNYKHGHSE